MCSSKQLISSGDILGSQEEVDFMFNFLPFCMHQKTHIKETNYKLNYILGRCTSHNVLYILSELHQTLHLNFNGKNIGSILQLHLQLTVFYWSRHRIIVKHDMK